MRRTNGLEDRQEGRKRGAEILGLHEFSKMQRHRELQRSNSTLGNAELAPLAFHFHVLHRHGNDGDQQGDKAPGSLDELRGMDEQQDGNTQAGEQRFFFNLPARK
jgi:hypothetical protein